MRNKAVPLWGLDTKGKSFIVTAQRHLNLYAEIKRQEEKAKVVFYGTAGTTLFTDGLGDTPIRGWIEINDVFYAVHRGTLYEINNAATITSRGTLNTTSGFVDMAYDGAVILIVDGTNGYNYTPATTTFAQILDADFPNGANTCDWLAGQFVVDDGSSDEFFISPDGSSWDALDFATAESAPDGLVRVFVDNGEVLLFGTKTTEPWGNVGGADFPFAPIQGGISEFGLVARQSVTKFNSGIAAIMRGTQGQAQVMFIRGYVPTPISTPEFDTEMNSYASISDATAYAYLQGGHPFLQINFSAANKSWLYDASTGLWSPIEYGLDGDRHRGEMFLPFINRLLISDYENGNIYELDPDTYTDNGTAIAREIISRHFYDYDNQIRVRQLFVEMETGVGLETGQGSDPQAMLSISKNGGRSYGNELWKTIGAIGRFMSRVLWNRLGVGADWTFKIRITDPIKVVIAGASMKVSQ